jgi:hypothetical protein
MIQRGKRKREKAAEIFRAKNRKKAREEKVKENKAKAKKFCEK